MKLSDYLKSKGYAPETVKLYEQLARKSGKAHTAGVLLNTLRGVYIHEPQLSAKRTRALIKQGADLYNIIRKEAEYQSYIRINTTPEIIQSLQILSDDIEYLTGGSVSLSVPELSMLEGDELDTLRTYAERAAEYQNKADEADDPVDFYKLTEVADSYTAGLSNYARKLKNKYDYV